MTFPLVPRGRVVGLSFGTMRSLRRGRGSDVAGSRPYQVGDDVHAIDWAASARLSAASQSDQFVVRERFAEESPRVVIVCDRRPAMSFYAPPLPWVDKGQAMRRAAELIFDSAALVGGFVGYLDHAGGEPYWEPPRGGRRLWEVRHERLASSEFAAPPDSVGRALTYLGAHRRSVTPGSFVFVLSDFLPPPSEDAWRLAIEHRWDLVPVLVQDPTWEQSFPDVSGIVVPLRDAQTGRLVPVRLRRREAAARRAANEERFQGIVEDFRALDLEPVVVSSSDPVEILAAFLSWSDLRRARRVA